MFLQVNITTEGSELDHSYNWTKDGIPLQSNSRVEFHLRGIDFVTGRGGMKRSDSGVYRLNVSNIFGFTVTYLILDVQCEGMPMICSYIASYVDP